MAKTKPVPNPEDEITLKLVRAASGGHVLSIWNYEKTCWVTVKASNSLVDITDEAKVVLTNGDYQPIKTDLWGQASSGNK